MSFDKLETAARARDIILKAASKQISNNVPKPLIGRMMSVDLPRLTGMVWFPGDDQPIEVSIFANAIPADWQHKRAHSLGQQSSTEGYGAEVVVERLNGTLYVTHILRGGQAALDMQSLGFSLLAQKGIEYAGNTGNAIPDIAGNRHETFINCQVVDETIGWDQALEFGPFTRYDEGTPGAGFLEVTVKGTHTVKSYRFVADLLNEFEDQTDFREDVDLWHRLLPEQSIHDTGGAYEDFDLEIAFKRTAYGNTAEFGGWRELWFRVIKRKSLNPGLDCFITIRATNIQHGRSLGGRELFMQRKDISPSATYGYIGFHGAQHQWKGGNGISYDNFGKVVSNGWGSLEAINMPWIRREGGSSSNFSVDGQSGRISATAVNTYYAMTGPYTDVSDIYWSFSVSATATGAPIRTGAIINYDTSTGDFYLANVELQTTGTISVNFRKRIGGVHSVIGGTTATGISYSAGQKFHCRVYRNAYDGRLWLKIWNDGTHQPPSWIHAQVDTDLFSGDSGLFAHLVTGNTNTLPVTVSYDRYQSNEAPYNLNQHTGKQWHSGPWRSGHLRVASDLQKTWTHDGHFTWDGTYLNWTGEIFFSGIGMHREGLAMGLAWLPMPGWGTGFNVPRFPQNNAGDGGYVFCSSSTGVPLLPEQSLWCAIPPGIEDTYLNDYLFIVDSSITEEFQLPEWAVLIASRGPAGAIPQVRLGNGTVLDRWRAASYYGSWTDWEPGASPVGNSQGAYRMEAGNRVVMKGLIKNTSGVGVGGSVINIPIGFRPALTENLQTMCSTGFGGGMAWLQINHATGDLGVSAYFAGGGSFIMNLNGLSWVAAK